MHTKYVVFWYPTLFHSSFSNRPIHLEKIEKVEISDYITSSCFKHELYIEKSYEDVHVRTGKNFQSYSKEEAKKKDYANLHVTTKCVSDSRIVHDFILYYQTRSNNGFVVYSYDADVVDLSTSPLLCPVYHNAKSLYHVHEINHTADSGLEAYIVDDVNFTPQCILKADNEVLQDYLMQYEDIFRQYMSEISQYNAVYTQLDMYFSNWEQEYICNSDKNYGDVRKAMKELLERLGDKDSKSVDKMEPQAIRLKFRSSILRYIREKCENSMIEYAYCDTLLKSKYNIEIRCDANFSKQELLIHKGFNSETCTIKRRDLSRRDKNRKIAVNILGSIHYIECVRAKCIDRAFCEANDRIDESNVVSKKTFWVGISLTIVFGIISIILSIISLNQG